MRLSHIGQVAAVLLVMGESTGCSRSNPGGDESESTRSSPTPMRIAEWSKYSYPRHRTGPENAAVVVVVFQDFQCPHCRLLARRLKVLAKEHHESLAVGYW